MGEYAIRAVFYAEFDNVIGPKMVFQDPPGALSPDVFDSVSDYVITQPQLCGKIISVVPVPGTKLMGFPVRIEHDKYTRNALMFNVGFVFDVECNTLPYEAVLRKLATTLRTLELERGFLSREEYQTTLQDLLPIIRAGLNDKGQVVMPLCDDSDLLALQLSVSLPSPPIVHDYDVPVRVKNLDALVCKEWDLSLRRIVPFVDGVSYVRRIALAADIEISVVKRALRHLVVYGCVRMIDIFQYCNVYATTEGVAALASSPKLQSACVRFVAARRNKQLTRTPAPPSASTVEDTHSKSRLSLAASTATMPPSASAVSVTTTGRQATKAVTWQALFALYCAFGSGRHMEAVCSANKPHAQGVDDRRLVTFGVVHGFLRRLHEYPVVVGPRRVPPTAVMEPGEKEPGDAPPDLGEVGVDPGEFAAALPARGVAAGAGIGPAHVHGRLRVKDLCDGRRHMDDISVTMMRSYDEVKQELDALFEYVVIRK